MEETSLCLTIYFDGQFWIGLFEKIDKDTITICKYTFGAEPKDSEVFEFIINKWNCLEFGGAVSNYLHKVKSHNPKTVKRKIKALLINTSIGTKAQQAVKLQTEQGKIARKAYNKEKREEDSRLKYVLRQINKKEKHKGH